MDEQTVEVTSGNVPCTSATLKAQRQWVKQGTLALALMREVLGGAFETVGTRLAGSEREKTRVFAKYHRLRCECPFPPEPDWK